MNHLPQDLIDHPFRCAGCGKIIQLTLRDPLPADWTVTLQRGQHAVNIGQGHCEYRCGECGG